MPKGVSGPQCLAVPFSAGTLKPQWSLVQNSWSLLHFPLFPPMAGNMLWVWLTDALSNPEVAAFQRCPSALCVGFRGLTYIFENTEQFQQSSLSSR